MRELLILVGHLISTRVRLAQHGDEKARTRSRSVVQQRRNHHRREDRHGDNDVRAEHLQVLRSVPPGPGSTIGYGRAETAGRTAEAMTRLTPKRRRCFFTMSGVNPFRLDHSADRKLSRRQIRFNASYVPRRYSCCRTAAPSFHPSRQELFARRWPGSFFCWSRNVASGFAN